MYFPAFSLRVCKCNLSKDWSDGSLCSNAKDNHKGSICRGCVLQPCPGELLPLLPGEGGGRTWAPLSPLTHPPGSWLTDCTQLHLQTSASSLCPPRLILHGPRHCSLSWSPHPRGLSVKIRLVYIRVLDKDVCDTMVHLGQIHHVDTRVLTTLRLVALAIFTSVYPYVTRQTVFQQSVVYGNYG